MSNEKYDYLDYREKLFTDDGQKLFLVVRDEVHKALKLYGAFRIGDLDRLVASKGNPHTNWELYACVDRLVELGEIREITPISPRNVLGQDRVFIKSDHYWRMT